MAADSQILRGETQLGDFCHACITRGNWHCDFGLKQALNQKCTECALDKNPKRLCHNNGKFTIESWFRQIGKPIPPKPPGLVEWWRNGLQTHRTVSPPSYLASPPRRPSPFFPPVPHSPSQRGLYDVQQQCREVQQWLREVQEQTDYRHTYDCQIIHDAPGSQLLVPNHYYDGHSERQQASEPCDSKIVSPHQAQAARARQFQEIEDLGKQLEVATNWESPGETQVDFGEGVKDQKTVKIGQKRPRNQSEGIHWLRPMVDFGKGVNHQKTVKIGLKRPRDESEEELWPRRVMERERGSPPRKSSKRGFDDFYQDAIDFLQNLAAENRCQQQATGADYIEGIVSGPCPHVQYTSRATQSSDIVIVGSP